jgi:hypothetical protein
MTKTLLITIIFFQFILCSANKIAPKLEIDPNGKVEILNISTNGVILPNNTISFNGVVDLDIEFDIKVTYTGSNVDFRKGYIGGYFYEPNSFDNETAEYYNNGVIPLHLFTKFLPLSYNSTGYTSTYRQKLRFKRNTVYNTGNSFVIKYRTDVSPNKILKKLTISIVGGTKTGNEPLKAETASATLTNLSYKNGSPVLNNKIIIPDSEGDDIGTESINLSLSYNCNYGSKLKLSYYPGIQVQIKDDLSVRKFLTEWITPTIINGTATFNDLKIKSSDLSPTSYLKIRFTFQEIDTYITCAIVKGNNQKPILDNNISDNQTIKYGQTAKIFTPSTIPYVDYTVPCNSRSGCSRDFRYLNTFKWQTRTLNTNWSDIPGVTTKEYSPTKTFTENTYYRRLAFYNADQYSISNICAIIIENTNIQNSICCDQTLPFKNSQPMPINANNINSTLYTYQWQSAKNSLGINFQPWHDIAGATNQNYNHTYTQDAATNDEKTRFRRIIKYNALPVNISNSITISRYSTTSTGPTRADGTRPVRGQSLNSSYATTVVSNEEIINNTNIYPNPFTNNFVINGPIDINLIKLYDSFGQTINIEKKQIDNNIIEVNTEKLKSGIFILKIDNTTFSKTLLKN